MAGRQAKNYGAGEKLTREKTGWEKGVSPRVFFFFLRSPRTIQLASNYLNAHYLNPTLQKSTGSEMFPEGCYAAKAAEKEKKLIAPS